MPLTPVSEAFYVQMDVGFRCPIPRVPDTVICAHHEDLPPAQICVGDSGGPLMLDESGYGVVIGVTSMIVNAKCPQGDLKCFLDLKCNSDSVAVYTKVDAYLPWIKETTGQGNSCAASPTSFFLGFSYGGIYINFH